MIDVLAMVVGAMAPVALLAARRSAETELDRLFARLRAAPNAASARALSEQIWQCWMHHDDPEVNALMERGIRAMAERDYEAALPCFDEVVERDPHFAEGWNKRATIRYLLADYAGSVRDIKRTLALEPRHFGALAGLGAVYLLIANDRGALDAFEAILALNPYLDSVRKQVEALRGELGEGEG